MDDLELLARYAQEQDQQAFTELVRRHGGWVYAAARRQVGDGHAAEDVTQAVFVLLSRRAGKLVGYGYLGGWLFRTLSYCVKEAVRERVRRGRREEEAARMRSETAGAEAGWAEIAPELEAAVGRLGQADREAVLLRFYEQKPLAEVGRALGVSEEAARKRVERAVGRLRERLVGRGVEMEAGSLAGVMLAQAGLGGPAGLVESVVQGVGNSTAGGIAKGAAKMMVLGKVKMAVGVVLAAVALGIPAVYVVGADQGSNAVAVPEPTTREVVEVLDGAPSLEELAAALEKHDGPLQNLHVEGFATQVDRRPSLDVEWKRTPLSARGDAWFSGGLDGKGRIRYASRVLSWENGTATSAETREDIAFDGQTSYSIRHLGGAAGRMWQDGMVTISGKRDTTLDLGSMTESAIETGAIFTLWHSFGPKAQRHSALLREAIAKGKKLKVERVHVDGVELIRVTGGDRQAASYYSTSYDPQHGYAIRRQEGWMFGKDGKVRFYERRTISSFVEAGSGVWFPTAAEFVEFDQFRRDWARYTWTAHRVEANRKEFDEKVFVPEYPATYHVSDTRTDAEYRASRQGDEFREGKRGGIEPDKLARAKEMYRVGSLCVVWANEHNRSWPGRLEELKGFTPYVGRDETKGWDQWVYYPPGRGWDQGRAVLFEKVPAFADGELVVFGDGFVEFVRDRGRLAKLREEAGRGVKGSQ